MGYNTAINTGIRDCADVYEAYSLVKEKMQDDYNVTLTDLSSNTSSVPTSRYRVAMRFVKYELGYELMADYHFWRENASGLWAHKGGPRPSAQLTDTDNPTYSYVDYPFNTDAADGWTSTGDSTAPHCWYTSPTVYFSCPLGYY